MSSSTDLGKQAIERILALWEVDDDRIEWTEHGFDWWPGRHRVSVTVLPRDRADDEPSWRLVVRTQVLRNVDLESADRIAGIAKFSHIAPSYGWVYVPAEASRKYGQNSDGRVEFWTTAYIRGDNIGWLPRFIGGIGILQPIEAYRRAEKLADALQCEPDTSGPGGHAPDDHVDDLLGIDESFFVPSGQQTNQFQGLEEYAAFADRFASNDRCFGNGDSMGLTFETPIGQDSALVRLRTDVPHPLLGAGLLVSLELPFVKDEATILDDCAWLNFFESRSWTNVPQMGSWHPRRNADGDFRAGHSFFVPNGVFSPGLATNAALWQFGRARWVKDTFHKDLEDLTMEQVYQRRFGGSAGGKQ